MTVFKRTMRLLCFAVASVSGSWSFAQSYHPFAEPMEFDPNWQWFAPVHILDFEELTARQRARHGWYVTYDRMRQGFARSEQEDQAGRVDFTWGNRWDAGFMNNEDDGWNFSAFHISGPNVYNETLVSRLNIYNEDDNADNEDFIPLDWRNDVGYGERFYRLRDSLNAGKFSHLEINKTWRREPTRLGGIVEPMVGVRLSDFTDLARNDNYTTFPVDTDLDFAVDSSAELLTSEIVETSNRMLAPQVGVRYYKYYSRWTLSTDFKGFLGANWQSQHSAFRQFQTIYDGIPPGVGDDPILPVSQAGTSFAGRKNQEFVIGLDWRAESAYQVTRAIELRMGFNLLYYGRGIWRGATLISGQNPNLNDQELVMPGFTFGFAINR
ncbi:MAG: hypothetical protein ACOVNV_00130 [Pirellulaceae bacterium]